MDAVLTSGRSVITGPDFLNKKTNSGNYKNSIYKDEPTY